MPISFWGQLDIVLDAAACVVEFTARAPGARSAGISLVFMGGVCVIFV